MKEVSVNQYKGSNIEKGFSNANEFVGEAPIETILGNFEKGIIDGDTMSSAIDALDSLEKGKKAEVGEIRVRKNGTKYQKTADGWKPVKAEKKSEKKAEPKKDGGTVDSYVEEMAGGAGSAVDHVIEVVLNAQGSKNTKANVKYLFDESGMDKTEFLAEVEVELKNEYKLAPSEEMTEKEFVDDFLPSIKEAIK